MQYLNISISLLVNFLLLGIAAAIKSRKCFILTRPNNIAECDIHLEFIILLIIRRYHLQIHGFVRFATTSEICQHIVLQNTLVYIDNHHFMFVRPNMKGATHCALCLHSKEEMLVTSLAHSFSLISTFLFPVFLHYLYHIRMMRYRERRKR